jgi:hypothetical protein
MDTDDAASGLLVDTVRPAELLPFRQEISILIENLNPVVRSVGDKQTASGIHGETVGDVEFTWCRPMVTPGFDEFAVLGEFDHAVVRLRHWIITMAVGDKNVAIGRDEDIGWRSECVGTSAGDTGLAERPHDLPVRREFHDSLVLSVGDPDGAVRSGEQAVRPAEQSGHQLEGDSRGE